MSAFSPPPRPPRLRPPERPRTAFVLSGGGNQGVSQVGMLRALLERGIEPDVVIGTSAGALNGAALATHPTLAGVEQLADVWLSIRSGEVFPGSKLARAWNVLRRDDHLFTNDGLRAVIERARAAPTFAELAVPLRVIATDLDTGDEVVLACGPVEPALLASTALPGLFPPIEHDGRLLVDGAIVNSVPLWHALSGPVDRIYVCNVTGALADRKLRSPLDVAVRAFAISRNQRFELELRYAPADVDVVVLPAPADQRELFDFSDSLMLIEEAHHLAARALDEHEAARARPRERARRRWFRRRSEVA
ncbi:MAG TPA: patatin-like phospholipase family protein [Acidimicrobiia bacterium]|nr:patatin-like phospholipase family protein [Acidimicrobiia bacterium]